MTLVAALFALLLSSCAPQELLPEASDAAAASTSAGPATFRGAFSFAGGQRELDRVHQAIERAVAALPAFKDFARQRLLAANAVPDVVSMTMEGNELVVVYGNHAPQRAPLDGSVRKWRNADGGTSKLKHELRDGKLVQTTWSDAGRRIMVWALDDPNGVLRVHSTMTAPQLPVPVRYQLTFRR
jgi:hypothetical protein